MLLTKESGGVFFISLALYECIAFAAAPTKNNIALYKKMRLIFIPVLIASINFIIQKIKFGWFLYPFYMDYISSTFNNYAKNIATVSAYSFIYDGRNGFSIFIIISILAIFISRKIKFTQNEKKIIPALSGFIIFYVVFCTLNYYIPRYLMCIFPPLYIVGTVLIDKVFSRIKIVFPLIIIGLMTTSIFYYTQPKASGDIDCSPAINTDLQMVIFCEQQHLYDNHIFARGLFSLDLCQPNAGYLSGEKFNHIEWAFCDNTGYCIFSGEESNNELFNALKKEYKLELMK